MGLVGRPVVAEYTAALVALGFRVAVPLAVEPGHHTAQEAHCGRSLLVSQHLDLGKAGASSMATCTFS